MKCLIILSIALLSIEARFTSRVHQSWNLFKATNGKQYESYEEELRRQTIFAHNLNKIDEHNKLHEQGLVSYKLKVNSFADLTDEEFNTLHNGYQRGSSTRKMDISPFVPPEDAEIPETLDWREQGAVTPVKSQGGCGACWAFSAAGALEGQVFLKRGKLVRISEQNLVDCSKNNGNLGCNGGLMDAAFQYVKNNDGIDSEASYPYEAAKGACRYNVANNVTSDSGTILVESGNEEDMKVAVATAGPLAVAIDARQSDFRFYSDGVYYNKNCKTKLNELNHGVLVVGYGTENGEDYWLVKNSWDEDFGIDGYIKMARNRGNVCGIATDSSYPSFY